MRSLFCRFFFYLAFYREGLLSVVRDAGVERLLTAERLWLGLPISSFVKTFAGLLGPFFWARAFLAASPSEVEREVVAEAS
jgi:hypothetical protein